MRLFLKLFFCFLLVGILLMVLVKPIWSYFFTKLPIPIALVGREPIFSNVFYNRLNAITQQKLNVSKADLLEKLIFETKVEISASKNQATLIAPQNLIEFDQEALKIDPLLNKAVNAQAQEDSVRFWYNSQKKYHLKYYETAEFLKVAIGSGKSFTQLALDYSEDLPSKKLGGDLGGIKAKNLLFELQTPLLNLKLNEIMILPSRLGLHLFQKYSQKIGETGEDVLYLKQIFLQTNDFYLWVEGETKNQKIKKLIPSL